MSIALRVVTTQQVVRITAEGQAPFLVMRPSPRLELKLSEVGLQGPQGQQGPPGVDGAAQMPPEIDGGSF